MRFMRPYLTVIIPNYNEAENIRRGVLKNIARYLHEQSYSWEVIISDDGSTDASHDLITQFIARDSHFKLLKNVHAGKPFALRAAVKQAVGQYVLLTDMDQSTPIDQLDKLLPYTKDQFKVIIGSRGAQRTNSSFVRKYIVSLGFLTVRRLILLPQIVDTQCGFKLLETNLAKKIFARMRLFGRAQRAQGWKVTAYDVELLYLAQKLGAEIQEVRVAWKDEDTSSGKNRNFIKESIEMFAEILRVRINDLLGKYNV